MREPAVPGRNKTALSMRRSKSSFRFSYAEMNLLFVAIAAMRAKRVSTLLSDDKLIASCSSR
jgi:hypothetical protein